VEADRVASGFAEEDPLLKLTGAAASESAFKQMAAGRRVIHLATHAFLLQDGCSWSAGRGEGPPPRGGSASPDPPRAAGDNPLLLTGMALAGANRREETDGREDVEDGILTAEEIASLDLSGVEWAVLSACETGVGAVRSGEGVLGLRRAFQVAGVRTLIMSLWPVEDAMALAWMTRLYEARGNGLDSAGAVREAGRAMIETRRREGGGTHPFYWGAFVAAGDWR
jgi:CHAT domain-containing protein